MFSNDLLPTMYINVYVFVPVVCCVFTIALVVVGTVVPEVIGLVTVVVVDGDDIGLVAVVDTVN